MSLASVGYREVEAIVESWTKKYQYHISLLQSKENEVKFMVEFSLTTPEKPIPIGTIRVYFICKESHGVSITFRFEKDSLIHSVNKTIRHQEMERWIDDALAKKLLVRQTVFYLGTAYESTRVKDPRQDKILEEKVVEKEEEFVYIHPDLLADQQRSIDIMERPSADRSLLERDMALHFQKIDKEGIQVLTYPEFGQLIKGIGLKLTQPQQKQLLSKVDPQESGMVEFDNYKAVVGEIFECLQAKRIAEAKLQQKRQEEIFGSILMLMYDEAQDIEEEMIQKFKAKDEDQTAVTNISEIKSVLEELNKKARQENKSEPISPVQMAELTKILTDAYGYKEIPYAAVHKHLINYKIGQLTVGRMGSTSTLLELHLRELFDLFDQKKFGKIKLEHVEEALNKSDKMKLTKAMIWVVKNIVVVDSKGEVNYFQGTKSLAEIIKKFYIHSSKKQKM